MATNKHSPVESASRTGATIATAVAVPLAISAATMTGMARHSTRAHAKAEAAKKALIKEADESTKKTGLNARNSLDYVNKAIDIKNDLAKHKANIASRTTMAKRLKYATLGIGAAAVAMKVYSLHHVPKS